MSAVEEIKAAIETLPRDEYAQLRHWFSERDWQKWDQQIEQDAVAGKLDFLIQEAVEEKAKGTLREL